MPNIFYDSLESVPEEFKSIAKEVDGKMAINVVPKATVDQFRDTNIQAKKDLDAALAQLSPLKEIVGEDPEAFKNALAEMRTTAQRVKDGELKETRQIEEALGKRTEEQRRDFDRQLQAKAAEAVLWQGRYKEVDTSRRRDMVANAIKDAAMDPESGVDTRAIADLIRAGHEVFSINDENRLIAQDGDAPIYGKDGMNFITPKEWLAQKKETNPYYFKASQGGGAGGDSSSKSKILGVDAKTLAGMTPQQKLALANDALARKRASGQ